MWNTLPEAEELLPLIMASYTPEEAFLLTEMPFKGVNPEDLVEMKPMDPEEMRKRMDPMAKKGQVFRTVRGQSEKILTCK